MKPEDIEIGKVVETTVEWPGVPKSAHGIIVLNYNTRIVVAWNLKKRPYPMDKLPHKVAGMHVFDPERPLQDDFDKETELHYLKDTGTNLGER